MAHQSVLLLLLLLPFFTHAQSSVYLYKQESQSPNYGLIVTLRCTITNAGSVSGNKTFYREINGNTDMVRPTDGSENSLLLTFELMPSLEGFYYCQVGNITSNKLQLVAYPVLNTNISMTDLPAVPLGGTITVPCAYPRGAFEERYEVTWYRGVHVINTSAMEFNRYQVLRNFSLAIQEVKPGDASNGYYCQVRVNVTSDIIVRQAPFITVEVLDPITISQRLQERIVAPNTWARYTCKISGVPIPTIKWTFNGEEISESSSIHIENNTTTLRNIVTVTTTLLYLSSQESGQVACIGYHMEGERLAMVTSEAHLIVLTDQFTPMLSVDGKGPRLQVQFPSVIPGQFELLAYYYNQKNNVYSRKLISHPTFRNTRDVDIVIPAEKLPQFRTFTVQVTLSVTNKTGSRSTRSNEITFNEEFPSGTTTDVDFYCPETVNPQSSNSNSNPAVVPLLVVFIVLLIILIAVSIFVGVMFFVCNKRMKNFKLNERINSSDDRFEPDSGTVRASNPYSEVGICTPESALQHSRKNSISSHGSQPDAVNSDDNNEDDANDNLDHKNLKQWEEKMNKPETVDVDAMEVDDETGIRMHSNECHSTRIEYQQHKKPRAGGGEPHYVTNIAMHHRPYVQDNALGATANMKTTDSFEDLTFEAELLQSKEFPNSA